MRSTEILLDMRAIYRAGLSATLCLITAGGFVSAALAQTPVLVTGLSTDHVRIESNFLGAEITAFGEVNLSAIGLQQGADQSDFDIATTVIGPLQPVTIRRKSRVLGIWINSDSKRFINVPSFYVAHSTRPLEKIAAPDVARANRIGLSKLDFEVTFSSDIPFSQWGDFRNALLRLRGLSSEFVHRDDLIQFLSPSLFHTSFEIPADAPIGTYQVITYLLQDGDVKAISQNQFAVAKIGVEQTIYSFAQDWAALYGVATVLLALLVGWLASAAFRRD